MRTRPIFHSSDAPYADAYRVLFLALAKQKHLEDLLRKSGIARKTLRRDLDHTQHVLVRRRDRAKPVAELFRHAYIALPPRAERMAPSKLVPARRRRGRPRRSTTSSRISSQSL
jgi:hypothetical protein